MSTLRAFTMPKWGIEMTEGTLSEWNIREGDEVRKGQTVAQIETDKIVNEVEAEFNVTFVRLLAVAGQVYPVGALLAVMASEAVTARQVDEFVGSYRGGPASGPRSATPAAPESERAGASPGGFTKISPAAQKLAERLNIDPAGLAGSGRRQRVTYQDVEQASRAPRTVGSAGAVAINVRTGPLDQYFASAYAKRLALEHGVDLATLSGTGPHGRISRADVAAAAGVMEVRAPVSPGFESIKMSATRKVIARQLTLAKSTIPHFYLRTEANLDALMAHRAAAKREAPAAASVNDYFLRAAALALRLVPDVNIQVHGEEIRRFFHADIAVAVSTDRGLITPVVRAAETKSLAQLAVETRALAERARNGKLRTEEIEGGSFTVSNLGMFGIEQFDAIINPPQGAILAVGAATRGVVAQGNAIAVATVAKLSLSCDHRAIDGAVGARFLAALRELLEAPGRL